MTLECMRDETVRQIKTQSGSEVQIAAYHAVWNDALLNNGKPLPCPSCFMKGDIRRLKPISEEHGIAVVRCENCRETFKFDSPETGEGDYDGTQPWSGLTLRPKERCAIKPLSAPELNFKQTQPVQLNRIDYESLNSRQKEIFNFQKISGVLADYGFNCIKLADDWQGADFLAYHKDRLDTLKVQLKSRLTIDKKYKGKELFVAFPLNGHWFLVEHDTLIEKVGQYTNWLNTDSWIKNGCYHSAAPSAQLMQSLSGCKL